MKTEKKLLNPKPYARFRVKKLNQVIFYFEHQFRKFKKKKKNEFESLNLIANESNFRTCEIHNRIDKIKVNADFSEWRVKL